MDLQRGTLRVLISWMLFPAVPRFLPLIRWWWVREIMGIQDITEVPPQGACHVRGMSEELITLSGLLRCSA
jgi:hypothetical protein